ncbi:MAG: energy transducer TonB [Acidobacteriia bacterium]|nr:energy transducer TonB [Terriglobia bacterium]
MFDTMLETRRSGARARAVWPYPVAASMHFLVVGGIVATSLLMLQKVPDIDSPFWNQQIGVIIGPRSDPPLGEGGPGGRAPLVVPRRQAPVPHDIVQPREAPPQAPSPDRPEETMDEAVPGLDLHGIGGAGVGGPGWPWGVPNGRGDGLGSGGKGVGERVEPAPPSGPLDVTPDMVAPVLLRKVQPDYPAAARAARLPGFVLLQAVIGEDGNVEDVAVLRASSPLFTDAAKDAVRQWKYRAALQNGRPVRVYFSVRVEFQLK